MSKLEKFLQTAKGVAISGVVTAALLPVGHAVIVNHVNESLRQEVQSRAEAPIFLVPQAEFDGGAEWEANAEDEVLERMKVQERVLDIALSRIESRNNQLKAGLDAYGRLYDSLERMAAEAGDRLPAREQAQLLSEALRSGLKVMKAEAMKDRHSFPAMSEAETRLAAFGETSAETLKNALADKARTINDLIWDNDLLENVLGTLSVRFDDTLRAADRGEDAVDEATEAIQEISSILREYQWSESPEPSYFKP